MELARIRFIPRATEEEILRQGQMKIGSHDDVAYGTHGAEAASLSEPSD
jgi:hypothetical protein